LSRDLPDSKISTDKDIFKYLAQNTFNLIGFEKKLLIGDKANHVLNNWGPEVPV